MHDGIEVNVTACPGFPVLPLRGCNDWRQEWPLRASSQYPELAMVGKRVARIKICVDIRGLAARGSVRGFDRSKGGGHDNDIC